MKQIRHSVFETNSSSTHVLCLNKNMVKEKHILGMNFTKEEKYPDVKYGITLGYKNVGFNGKFYTFPYFLTFLLKRFVAEI